MRKFFAMAVTAAVLFCSPTMAAMNSMKVASDLANTIGAEAACGLQFKQDAIEKFIAQKVAADDMEFPGFLTLMTDGVERKMRDMSPSALTAHCTQVKRIAKSYGFID